MEEGGNLARTFPTSNLEFRLPTQTKSREAWVCGVASRDKERNGRGATRGGMAHEEQNDPVAQSSTSKSPTTSTADLSERDNKENPVVKEEETNDTEVFLFKMEVPKKR